MSGHDTTSSARPAEAGPIDSASDDGRFPRDTGAVAIWTLGVVLVTFVAVGVLVDIGGAITAKTSTLDFAQQAARAGAGQIDLAALRSTGTLQIDPQTAHDAAADFLTRQGVTGDVDATTTRVHVTAETRHATVLLRIVGVNSITLSATAAAQASNTQGRAPD